jgi:hypothetical protein
MMCRRCIKEKGRKEQREEKGGKWEGRTFEYGVDYIYTLNLC